MPIPWPWKLSICDKWGKRVGDYEPHEIGLESLASYFITKHGDKAILIDGKTRCEIIGSDEHADVFIRAVEECGDDGGLVFVKFHEYEIHKKIQITKPYISFISRGALLKFDGDDCFDIRVNNDVYGPAWSFIKGLRMKGDSAHTAIKASGSNIIIDDCLIEDSLIGVHAGHETEFTSHEIVVRNCKFVNCATDSVRLDRKSPDSYVFNNIMRGNPEAHIRIRASAQYIEKNHCYGGPTHHIYIDPDGYCYILYILKNQLEATPLQEAIRAEPTPNSDWRHWWIEKNFIYHPYSGTKEYDMIYIEQASGQPAGIHVIDNTFYGNNARYSVNIVNALDTYPNSCKIERNRYYGGAPTKYVTRKWGYVDVPAGATYVDIDASDMMPNTHRWCRTMATWDTSIWYELLSGQIVRVHFGTAPSEDTCIWYELGR